MTLRFKRNLAFGKTFRFHQGDTARVEKIRPDGTIVFWPEKFPEVPFELKAKEREYVDLVGESA